MKMELNTKELKDLERASDITGTDYNIKGNLIDVDDLIVMISDLLVEIGVRDEKIEELEAPKEEEIYKNEEWV